MGFFDKKYCDVCGEKIGLLGNRKLDDGNLCKDCAKKLSPWFEERRHSTVEQIKQQLAYREENKSRVQDFDITKEFDGSPYNIYIDENKGQFAVAMNMNVDSNPDIINLDQITDCRLDIREDKDRERYRGEDGEMHDFNPPRYKYYYNYKIMIKVDSPWFDDINVALHSMRIAEHDRGQIRNMERLGDDIVKALTAPRYENRRDETMTHSMGDTAEAHSANTGDRMAQQTAVDSGSWVCGSCGASNTGKFCEMCGQPRPDGNTGRQIRCQNCGWTPDADDSIPKFCPECGTPFNK